MGQNNELMLKISNKNTIATVTNSHYSFVPSCTGGRGGGGSNKMHQGGNYGDFLKWWGGVFKSFSYNN